MIDIASPGSRIKFKSRLGVSERDGTLAKVLHVTHVTEKENMYFPNGVKMLIEFDDGATRDVRTDECYPIEQLSPPL